MNTTRFLSILAAALAPLCSSAHVSLDPAYAETGGAFQLTLRVGHGCEASPTTAITVRMPAGFEAVRAVPHAGWTVENKPGAITWTAATRDAALPSKEKGEFLLAGTAPRAAGPVWLKVLQACAQGSQEWAEVPAQGTSTAGLKNPAVLLDVLAPREFAQARMLPRIEGGWVRGSVPGQSGTGAFMRLTANEPVQLVGASTPVAGTAEVHEMKMEGDVMRMRPVGKLDLPAGQPVDLKPGGFHIMLTDLKQPLQKDAVVPLTLVFRNARGLESRLEVKLPVALQGPDGATDTHKH